MGAYQFARNDEFEKYVNSNLERTKQEEAVGIERKNDFLDKYPLERLKNLTLEEYCLGTDRSKDSLSYLMEFGKIGFGIGGGTSKNMVFITAKKTIVTCMAHNQLKT